MKIKIIRRAVAGLIGSLLMLGVTVAAYGFHTTSTQTADCPGTVECPLTGEDVCRDKCPLLDANRADCPGKVECPLTGELVCRDLCPLGTEGNSTDTDTQLPACCRGEK